MPMCRTLMSRMCPRIAQMPVKVVTTTASTAWVIYDSLGETFEVAVSHDAAILCVQESITVLRKTGQCYSRKDNAEYNAVKTAIQTDCEELPSITLYGQGQYHLRGDRCQAHDSQVPARNPVSQWTGVVKPSCLKYNNIPISKVPAPYLVAGIFSDLG